MSNFYLTIYLFHLPICRSICIYLKLSEKSFSNNNIGEFKNEEKIVIVK